MASLAARLINDQNLSVNFNGGGSVEGNMNVTKVQKKGGFGGRKPLGDLSNAGIGKPSLNQAPKKQNSRNFASIDDQIESSKIKGKADSKLTTSKASEKKQLRASRKALSDISNSKGLNTAPKALTNQSAKLSVLAESSIDINAIAEEGFLHNHEECIKQQARASAMDMDYFLETLGLHKNKDNSKQFSSPWMSPVSRALEPDSPPPNYLKGEEYDLSSPFIDARSSGLDSPNRFSSRGSPDFHMEWMDLDVSFTLAESPIRMKH